MLIAVFKFARLLQSVGYALSWPGRKIQYAGEAIESWLAVERDRAIQRVRMARAKKQGRS